MTSKVGRNDPCPCGSGKKYKQCCWKKRFPLGKRKFKVTVVSSGGSPAMKKTPDLMERTFGNAIRAGEAEDKPPIPPSTEEEETVKEEEETS
ncbi:MAG: SEC-C metal-binding domain-containing protein [Waddliaceae bacterium]